MSRRGAWREMKLTEEFQEIPDEKTTTVGRNEKEKEKHKSDAADKVNEKTTTVGRDEKEKEKHKSDAADKVNEKTTTVGRNEEEKEKHKSDAADKVNGDMVTKLSNVILNLREKRKTERENKQMLLEEKGKGNVNEVRDKIQKKTTKKKKTKQQIDSVNPDREMSGYESNISALKIDVGESSRIDEQDQSKKRESSCTKGLSKDTEQEEDEMHTEEFENTSQNKVKFHTETDNAPDWPDFTSKSFHISLSSAQWETIKPLDICDTRRKLGGDWTDMLSNKVCEKFHGCVLVFNMNRVKSLNSRKIKAPFFNGRAECKGALCTARFAFIIEQEPIPGHDVEIFCTVEGSAIHFPDEINKRQIKGVTRSKVGEVASQIGAVNYYYDALAETPEEELEMGNITRCQTPSVIRKIVSEVVTKKHLHTDIVEELKLLKEAFETEDEEVGKTELKGYIQEISTDPFTVVLVSKDQIQLIRNLSTAKKLDIYIDATGSVIGNIPNQSKPYLYSIVVRPNSEVPPISVADMLTTQHHIPRLEFFMASLKRAVEMGGRKMNVRKVETDFSWVFIQSALKTFNLMNIKQYLLNCFNIIHKQKDREYLDNFTVVHLCSAHMIKDFSRHLHKLPNLTANKKVKRFAMQCFARLQNCVYLSEAETLFKLMCTVLGSPHVSKSVNVAYKVLEKKMKFYEDDIDEISPSSNDDYELTLGADESFSFEGKTIKEVSPFTQTFTQILNQVPISDQVTNNFYCPDVLTILTNTFLPLFPLWSGMMLQPLKYADEKLDTVITRDTNAPVEGWFKSVKQDVSRKSHEMPSKFVIKLRKTLKGRIKENAYPQIRKKRETATKVRNDSEIDVSLKTEKWGKKKPRTIPTYHRVPRQRPVSAGTLPSVPSWGGKVASKTLVNTCTIDNCLTIIYLKYLEDLEFREILTTGVYRVLQRCCQFMECGQFNEAKAHWLENTGTVLHQTTDVFGDEYDLFVYHIQDTFVTKLTSTCSEPSCPQPYRENHCHGIMLSTILKNPVTVKLDDLLETWDNFSCDCSAEYEEGVENVAPGSFVEKVEMVSGKRKVKQVVKYYCAGHRRNRRQVVAAGMPPILFVRVYEMVRNSGFPTDVKCYIGKLHLMSVTYRLVGATMYRPGHYTGVISTEKYGWLFYDGLIGYLQQLTPYMISEYTPSHLVFVRET